MGERDGRQNWETLYELERQQTAYTQSQVLKAQREIEIGDIALARARWERKEELATNKHHQLYIFNAAIDDRSAIHCMLQLMNWDRLDESPEMEIIFNSPGGNILDGLLLYDYVQTLVRKGKKVTTTAYGMAASMAAVLLQAGSHRAMGQESWLMIHEASLTTGGKLAEVEDTYTWTKRLQERLVRIFSERSKISPEELRERWSRKDWWMDSSEALSLGFVDEVR